MMKIITDIDFAAVGEAGSVFQIIPDVFADGRGHFTEVLKSRFGSMSEELPSRAASTSWIRQVNRSVSAGGTVRGCHAQTGVSCQGKLVEALTERIYDIIIDARPDSDSFGVAKVFMLDPFVQNKLWVPRGFLHSFAVPHGVENAVFQYFCDNVYDSGSEICVNPQTVLPDVVAGYARFGDKAGVADLSELFDGELTLSEKDKAGVDYSTWMKEVKDEYGKNRKVWYK